MDWKSIVLLTPVSVSKAIYFLKDCKAVSDSFSMSDVKKTLHLNKVIADRIIANLEISTSCEKIKKVYPDALWFGKIVS